MTLTLATTALEDTKSWLANTQYWLNLFFCWAPVSSLEEKSAADKKCKANLTPVRLQGQAGDKTGL